MPFCVQCGNAVAGADRFCAKCGAQQAAGGGAGSYRPFGFYRGIYAQQFPGGFTDRHAIIACYFPWIGWIASVIVLASARFRQDKRVRFHAFQGLYLFVSWMLVDWVMVPMLLLPEHFLGYSMFGVPAHLLQLAILGTWVFMLIKAAHGEDFHLPILGELAERSASEQRT